MSGNNGNGHGRQSHLAWSEEDLEFHDQGTVNETDKPFRERVSKHLPHSVFNYRLSQDVVIVEDGAEENRSMSVTNDAENVVKFLHDIGVLQNRRLIYRDTVGRWDEMIHDGKGNFVAFSLLGALTEEEAIEASKK